MTNRWTARREGCFRSQSLDNPMMNGSLKNGDLAALRTRPTRRKTSAYGAKRKIGRDL